MVLDRKPCRVRQRRRIAQAEGSRTAYNRFQEMAEIETIKTLEKGAAIVLAVLAPHAFELGPIQSGIGSGGSFASCEFIRDNRRLRVSFRYSLGLVEYQLDDVSLSHEDYMWSVHGQRWAGNYPGFSKDALDGFRHLAADLARYGQDFVFGSDHDFLRHVSRSSSMKPGASRIPD